MARYLSNKRLCLVTKEGMIDFMSLVHGSEYVTSNPRIQKAIEETGLYKSGAIVKEAEVEPSKAVAQEPKMLVVPEVTNCVQAKDWLSANRGIEWKGLVSRSKIFEVAAEQKVAFVNLPTVGKK